MQAKHASNEIAGYISVRIDTDALETGWLEKCLISKGVSGALSSKPNQVDYVIPLSTTIHAVLDRGSPVPGDFGVFFYGRSGIHAEKLVISYHVSDAKYFTAFRLANQSPHDVVRFILRHEVGETYDSVIEDSPLDYTDFLREYAESLPSFEGISLRMPSNWANPRKWIPESLANPGPDQMILKIGAAKDSAAFSLLLSNWVIQMHENLLVKDPIAAAILCRTSELECFIWDGPRDILTAFISNRDDIDIISANILDSLWATTEELRMRAPEPEHPTLGKAVPEIQDYERKLTKEEKRVLSRIERVLQDIDVNDTLRRVERAEAILSELKRMSMQEDERAGFVPSQIEARIDETLERIESLQSQLKKLEKRIEKVCLDIG